MFFNFSSNQQIFQQGNDHKPIMYTFVPVWTRENKLEKQTAAHNSWFLNINVLIHWVNKTCII